LSGVEARLSSKKKNEFIKVQSQAADKLDQLITY
jgi:hypothetical protein